jgi:hypothetical protein
LILEQKDKGIFIGISPAIRCNLPKKTGGFPLLSGLKREILHF